MQNGTVTLIHGRFILFPHGNHSERLAMMRGGNISNVFRCSVRSIF